MQQLTGRTAPRCACCPEERFWALTIDHVHGGGNVERRETGSRSTFENVWQQYKATGVWPRDKYQVLCATCNHGRRMNGGVCPHSYEHE